jgi:hypothetical protein
MRCSCLDVSLKQNGKDWICPNCAYLVCHVELVCRIEEPEISRADGYRLVYADPETGEETTINDPFAPRREIPNDL